MARVLSKSVCKTLFVDLVNQTYKTPAAFSLNSKRFESYNAAVLHETGRPLTIEEKTRKKLKKGDVRVRVRYAGVNFSDFLICKGEYSGVKQKLPFTPGYEVMGDIIETTPEGTELGFAVGDKVIALSKVDFGGFAQECIIHGQNCWHLPNSIKSSKGAALLETYSTALIGLTRRGHIKEKDIILIMAGPGGLGLAAVDVAANVYKAKVIGVCNTQDRATLLRDKGAWTAMTHDPKSMLKKVMEMTEKKGANVAFEAMGGQVCENLVNCVKFEGTLILAGAAAQKTPTNLVDLLLPTSVSMCGVSLTAYSQLAGNIYRQVVQDSIDMCEQGLIQPNVAQLFALEEVNEAFKYIEDKVSSGKVVIKICE